MLSARSAIVITLLIVKAAFSFIAPVAERKSFFGSSVEATQQITISAAFVKSVYTSMPPMAPFAPNIEPRYGRRTLTSSLANMTQPMTISSSAYTWRKSFGSLSNALSRNSFSINRITK